MRERSVVRAAIGACALFWSGAAFAQDAPVTLRFSHWSSPQHPMSTISVPDWVNAIEKASNGSIKIQVFPAQQLGKTYDHYDMARDGIADITWMNSGLLPGRFPIRQALELPWLYSDPQRATLAFYEWYLPLAQKEMSDVKICQLQVQFPSTLHSKREIKSVDDFKGLKLRIANSTQSRYFHGMGAVIVPVPATEARDAIEKGVAEAMLFPWRSLFIWGIDKLLTYHLDAPFSGNGFELMFNKASYNKLSANQKKIIDAHCTAEWSARFMAPWSKQEPEGRAELAAKPGHVVYPVSEKLRSDMRAATEPIRKEWAANVRKAGHDPDKVWNDLVAAMSKYKAN